MRRQISFTCAGSTLFATLDLPEGAPETLSGAGLLIVSGGNEVRAGAWNGQARIAARLAARGHAVLRFDRRGVGESEGENAGFRHSGPDIIAAITAFRAELPGLARVVGWGNCDAAAALMLGQGCGLDGLILSNPWTYDEDETAAEGAGSPPASSPAPLPPAALRAHYLRRLRDPRAILRLFSGKVSLGGLFGSLSKIADKVEKTGLCAEIAAGLAQFPGPARIVLAGRDRTAQAFAAQWDTADPQLAQFPLAHAPLATHSFIEPEAQEWLENIILDALT